MSVFRIRNPTVVDVMREHILTHVSVDIGAPVCIDTDLRTRSVRSFAWGKPDAVRLVTL
jgi:hypothetical protein